MDLRAKLGQRFIYALPDVTELTTEVADFLVDCRAGGLVLFGFNIKTLAQITKLNQDLQTLAASKGLPPFIISLDEEGGNVSRMPADGQDLITPSQMALGVAGPAAVEACANVTARRLRQLGFNFNYAPVMDVNNNPANPVIGTRSYGAEPAIVAELGTIAIEAYLQNAVSPCVKHFPGHGDTAVDSHYGLPIVQKSLEQLREFELVPFERAIRAGVPAIMTAHILYPQVETGGLPATFSAIFLSQLLREQLNFDGLIITDCLDMRAIADHYDLGEAAIMAFRAGADLVMLKGPLAEQRAAFEKAIAAAQANDFDEAASDLTIARLEKWRKRFCVPVNPTSTAPQDYEIVAQAARQSVTVIKSEANLLPLTATNTKRPLLLDFTLAMASPVEGGRTPGPLLEQELKRKLPNLTRLEISAETSPLDAERVRQQVKQSDLLLIVCRHALLLKRQADLIKELVAGDVAVVLVAAREPYDLDLFPDVSVAIATYGDPPATVKALAALLTGN